MFDLAQLDEMVLLGVADSMKPEEVAGLVQRNANLAQLLAHRRPDMVDKCRTFKGIVLQRLTSWDAPRILGFYQVKRPALFQALYTTEGYAWWGRQVDELKRVIAGL